MRRVPGLVSRVPGLVSRVPGLLEPCLPSLCFFLWSIRVSGLHQGSGILGLLFPFIVFLLVRDLFPGFRDFWNFVSHHCFCFVVHQGAGLHQGSGILGLLSPIIVFFLVVYQGSGIFGTLSPIIVFVLWSIRARDFIRVPGFLDFCFPSLCFFWFRDLSPEYQDLSPGFRDFWNLVSHHCVFFFCGLSGLRDFWKFPTAVCFWVSISGSRGLVPGMRSEVRGCAGFRDLSPGFRDLSPGFQDFWNLVSHHCVSFYGPSGFRGFIRVPGFLDPSLCFFWFGTCFPGSGTFGTLSPIIVVVLWSIRARDFIRVPGFLDFCLPSLLFPFIVFLLVRDLFPGFRDFWNFVSPHCFCSVVHQGAGLHQGSGILGLLSPIIVFFLVVYQGSGIFGTLSPIIVFVLWSIRARDFIRVPGFLDFCFPSLCFFWFRDLSPEFQDLSPGFRDF